MVPLLRVTQCYYLTDDNPNYLNGIIIMIAKVLVVENTAQILVVRGSVILSITPISIIPDMLLRLGLCATI